MVASRTQRQQKTATTPILSTNADPITNANLMNLGEIYHTDIGNNPFDPLQIKGRKVTTLYSQHLDELSVSSLFRAGLITLAEEHPDCYMHEDIFFYGQEMKRYMDLWIKAGSAYKELGFYHFVTLMGEEPRRADE